MSKVNSTPFLQGDTISFDCNDSWAESVNLSGLPGSAGLPITINSYGGCVSDTPTLEGAHITGSNFVIVDGLDLASSITGSLSSISLSNNVTFQNSTFSDSV